MMKFEKKLDKLNQFLDEITEDDLIKKSIISMLRIYRKTYTSDKKRSDSLEICTENAKKWDKEGF